MLIKHYTISWIMNQLSLCAVDYNTLFSNSFHNKILMVDYIESHVTLIEILEA